MPQKKDTIKSEDGRFYSPEEMKQLGLKPMKDPVKKDLPRKKAVTKKVSNVQEKILLLKKVKYPIIFYLKLH